MRSFFLLINTIHHLGFSGLQILFIWDRDYKSRSADKSRSAEAGQKLKEKLISSEFFVPQDWSLPRLHHHPYDPEIDHEWHEFEDFEWTEEPITDDRDVRVFLEEIPKGYEI
jgi:hypothetical protein